jgi:hypothetical protein
MRFAIGKTSLLMLCLTIALFVVPGYAATNVLVGSSESHSIEKFDSNGNWIKTFASTGPWIMIGLAYSPITGDVFVATNTETILRYRYTGASFGPQGSYWSTFSIASVAGSNPAQNLLFDAKGNLYVATYYGEFSVTGYQVEILKYSANELLQQNPVPSGAPIITTLARGDQMAWDASGNICIGSFIAPTVQCYNPSTGALAFDYTSEIEAAGIQPGGIAFGPGNILMASSIFLDQVWVETTPHVGPMTLLATGTVQPANVGWLAVDSSGMLYLPNFYNPGGRYAGSNPCTFYACMDYDFTSDVVYKIDPSSGALTNFITNHSWGPYQMIFVPF